MLEFQKEYGTVFDFDYEMPIKDAVTDVLCQNFNSAVELYDEVWFAEHTLIFMSATEPKLGYYYKAADASLENDVLNIEYERHAPLFLSAAVSIHLFLVELEISDLPENVTINWTKTVAPSPWDEPTQEATGGK
ncbi:MAG: hypothetical protein IJA58_06865 [Lachnospiraceae bacterium]|nr:hypothetical protein [Lachnospiraceae bacterium]